MQVEFDTLRLRLVQELDHIAAQIEQIESDLIHLVERDRANSDRPSTRQLQLIDLTAQSVQAIRGFLVGSKHSGQDDRVYIGDALRAVKLRDMRDRLGGHTRTMKHSGPEIF